MVVTVSHNSIIIRSFTPIFIVLLLLFSSKSCEKIARFLLMRNVSLPRGKGNWKY